MSRNRIFSSLFTAIISLLVLSNTTVSHAVALDGVPTPPSIVKAVAYVGTQPRVVITWNQAQDNVGVTRYNIYKDGTFMVSPTGVGVTYTDTNVTAGQSYKYSIQAGDGDGNNSVQSDTVVITVNEGATSQVSTPPVVMSEPSPVPVPSVTIYSSTNMQSGGSGTSPQNVALIASSENLRLSWKNPTGTDFHRVRVIRRTGSAPTGTTNGSVVYDGTAEQYIDRDVVANTQYYYGVYAVNQSYVASSLLTISGSLIPAVTLIQNSKPIIAPTNQPASQPVNQLSGQVVITTTTQQTYKPTEVGGTSAVFLAVTFTRTLKLGSTGEDVLLLQKFLNSHGFTITTSGPGSQGNETTYFGNATQKAVQAYQCQKKIVCEGNPSSTGYGLVGKTTRMYLNKE